MFVNFANAEPNVVRQVAAAGWTDNINNRYNDKWTHFAPVGREVTMRCVAPESVALCAGGSARLTIEGDVGAGSIVLCSGGGAEVHVFGDVAEDAKVLCMGGGAKVYVHGSVSPKADVRALGGGAEVFIIL